MIDNALVSLIADVATALSGRIRPSSAIFPDSTMPRCRYTRISGPKIHTDDGVSSLVKGRYQLDINADTLTAADLLYRQICGLDGYSGTADSTVIQRIYIPETPTSSLENLRSEGANQSVCRLTFDLLVDFHE